ncbi:MAG: hypothetical protein SF051_14665 [Elusimicrobiota bacterium]|nr:hypothetical protein [Elusimicrobiota bacterium]
MRRLLTLLLCVALPALAAGPRPLRLDARGERHVRERHFPGGSQTRGKSLFFAGTDLKALLVLAQKAKPRRQGNGRDKRVVDAGKPVGTDGRSGRPMRTVVVISEEDGLVITMYPGV